MRPSNIIPKIVLTFSLATPLVQAQQIASKDLLHAPVEVVDTPVQKQEKPELPNRCEKMGVGYLDGVTMAKDNLPRKFKIELVNISDTKFSIGSEIIARIKLQNAGTQAVQIPWSTDFQTTTDGQDPDNRSWEIGLFEISLKYKGNNYADLKNTSQPLYYSQFVPGSKLNMNPGEWITAQISFRVEVEHPEYEKISEGPAELGVEWFQTVRTRSLKGCGVMLGFYPYDGFYSHKNRMTLQNVEIQPPTTGKPQKAAQKPPSR